MQKEGFSFSKKVGQTSTKILANLSYAPFIILQVLLIINKWDL